MYLAHGPISYVLNETIQKEKISKLKPSEQFLVGILSFLFGILPDIDLLILSMTNIPSFQHHSLFTHSILFYIVIWLFLNGVIWVLKRVVNKSSRIVFNNELLDVIQMAFLIGVMSHLFADIAFSHSRILFPLKRQVTILGSLFQTNYFASYIFTPTFSFEILLVGVSSLMVYKKYFKKSIIFHTLIYCLMGVATLFFVISSYMNVNIYNKGLHFKDGMQNNDVDYDGIHDKYDSDIGNVGKNNILRLDDSKMVKFVENVSSGNYLVNSQASLVNRFAQPFGAFTSYRIVSQAYFEQNLPIEPVLRDWAKSKYGKQGYSLDISYTQVLYEYVKENFRERGIYTPGGIMFVTNKKDEVVNMGVVVNSGKVSMVLDTDKRLVLHELDKILQIYKGMTVRAFVLP